MSKVERAMNIEFEVLSNGVVGYYGRYGDPDYNLLLLPKGFKPLEGVRYPVWVTRGRNNNGTFKGKECIIGVAELNTKELAANSNCNKFL